jgi:hypothetical protein
MFDDEARQHLLDAPRRFGGSFTFGAGGTPSLHTQLELKLHLVCGTEGAIEESRQVLAR